MIEIFSQSTSHKNLMILAVKGAELEGGQISPPFPVRVILDPIPGRGLILTFTLFLPLCSLTYYYRIQLRGDLFFGDIS